MDIYPTIKVLFSDCSNGTEFQIRNVEEWITKNQADEVYMLASQIKELIEFLESANNVYPPSHSFLQGLLLSSLRSCKFPIIMFVARLKLLVLYNNHGHLNRLGLKLWMPSGGINIEHDWLLKIKGLLDVFF
ncbi:unnamed protein product [Ilex paraguariensis]|uniref:Uncharacterized protein n=1 Tax=Ilex paraguariensis TaxID=185542 RepID=A0ABC8SIU3_9AQUA